jgi:hypothetical protein
LTIAELCDLQMHIADVIKNHLASASELMWPSTRVVNAAPQPDPRTDIDSNTGSTPMYSSLTNGG